MLTALDIYPATSNKPPINTGRKYQVLYWRIVWYPWIPAGMAYRAAATMESGKDASKNQIDLPMLIDMMAEKGCGV
jgi:hypothetical protein